MWWTKEGQNLFCKCHCSRRTVKRLPMLVGSCFEMLFWTTIQHRRRQQQQQQQKSNWPLGIIPFYRFRDITFDCPWRLTSPQRLQRLLMCITTWFQWLKLTHSQCNPLVPRTRINQKAWKVFKFFGCFFFLEPVDCTVDTWVCSLRNRVAMHSSCLTIKQKMVD
jgi:hypothetical protein